jgi:hypothetical protein
MDSLSPSPWPGAIQSNHPMQHVPSSLPPGGSAVCPIHRALPAGTLADSLTARECPLYPRLFLRHQGQAPYGANRREPKGRLPVVRARVAALNAATGAVASRTFPLLARTTVVETATQTDPMVFPFVFPGGGWTL